MKNKSTLGQPLQKPMISLEQLENRREESWSRLCDCPSVGTVIKEYLAMSAMTVTLKQHKLTLPSDSHLLAAAHWFSDCAAKLKQAEQFNEKPQDTLDRLEQSLAEGLLWIWVQELKCFQKSKSYQLWPGASDYEEPLKKMWAFQQKQYINDDPLSFLSVSATKKSTVNHPWRHWMDWLKKHPRRTELLQHAVTKSLEMWSQHGRTTTRDFLLNAFHWMASIEPQLVNMVVEHYVERDFLATQRQSSLWRNKEVVKWLNDHQGWGILLDLWMKHADEPSTEQGLFLSSLEPWLNHLDVEKLSHHGASEDLMGCWLNHPLWSRALEWKASQSPKGTGISGLKELKGMGEWYWLREVMHSKVPHLPMDPLPVSEVLIQQVVWGSCNRAGASGSFGLGLFEPESWPVVLASFEPSHPLGQGLENYLETLNNPAQKLVNEKRDVGFFQYNWIKKQMGERGFHFSVQEPYQKAIDALKNTMSVSRSWFKEAQRDPWWSKVIAPEDQALLKSLFLEQEMQTREETLPRVKKRL